MDLFTTLNVLVCVSLVLLMPPLIRAYKDERSRCPRIVQQSGNYLAVRNHTCYMFVDKEEYWIQARRNCWQYGGELVKIDSADTMNFIKIVLNSQELGWNRNGVWNGASDLRKRGWEWTTGELLRYTYWEPGQPSKTFGFLSFENCALMRRGDNWRWHDYSCDSMQYHYNYICQFSVVHKPGEKKHIINVDKRPHEEEHKDDTGAIVGLAVATLFLVVVMVVIMFYLYRKKRQHKSRAREAEEAEVRFQNHSYDAPMLGGYTTIANTDSDIEAPNRPVSNVYLEPEEVNRLYDEVMKENNHGLNSLDNPQECIPLRCSGGAASAENLDGATCDGYISCQSDASGATSAVGATNCKETENGYLAMNGKDVGAKATNEYVAPTRPSPQQEASGYLTPTHSSPKPELKQQKPVNIIDNPIYVNGETNKDVSTKDNENRGTIYEDVH